MRQIIFNAAALLTLLLFTDAHAATRFNSPKWHNYALDWCKTFENGCGQPAADLWCQKKGYEKSADFKIQPSVSVQTMTVGQNAICNPAVHRCDSFQYIDCVETEKTFSAPMYNGYRLDWCRQFETNCGQPAANLYCQKRGFAYSTGFDRQNQLSVPTMTVGSNAICNPAYHVCDGFSYVTCHK